MLIQNSDYAQIEAELQHIFCILGRFDDTAAYDTLEYGFAIIETSNGIQQSRKLIPISRLMTRLNDDESLDQQWHEMTSSDPHYDELIDLIGPNSTSGIIQSILQSELANDRRYGS